MSFFSGFSAKMSPRNLDPDRAGGVPAACKSTALVIDFNTIKQQWLPWRIVRDALRRKDVVRRGTSYVCMRRFNVLLEEARVWFIRNALKEMTEYDSECLAAIKLTRGDDDGFIKELIANATPAEIAAERELESLRSIASFRKQVRFSIFVVDFCCKRAQLAIEIDGGVHRGRESYDNKRDAFLADEFGVLVIRFTNETILNNPNRFLATVKEVLEERLGA